MAADPRGLADLVAPLEGDDGAVRSPGALASAEGDTVEVPDRRAARGPSCASFWKTLGC